VFLTHGLTGLLHKPGKESFLMNVEACDDGIIIRCVFLIPDFSCYFRD
jgi:hypothetical protein